GGLPLSKQIEKPVNRWHIRQSEAGLGWSWTNLDAHAVHGVDGAKAVFVGDIVPDEHRRAAAEWLAVHEARDRLALVGAAGPRLDDHLALDRFKAFDRIENTMHGRTHLIAAF